MAENSGPTIATITLDYHERMVLVYALEYLKGFLEAKGDSDLFPALPRLIEQVANAPCGDPTCSICGKPRS